MPLFQFCYDFGDVVFGFGLSIHMYVTFIGSKLLFVSYYDIDMCVKIALGKLFSFKQVCCINIWQSSCAYDEFGDNDDLEVYNTQSGENQTYKPVGQKEIGISPIDCYY